MIAPAEQLERLARGTTPDHPARGVAREAQGAAAAAREARRRSHRARHPPRPHRRRSPSCAQFQDLGHTAILLIGDFTGMIGDPERQVGDPPAAHAAKQVEANAADLPGAGLQDPRPRRAPRCASTASGSTRCALRTSSGSARRTRWRACSSATTSRSASRRRADRHPRVPLPADAGATTRSRSSADVELGGTDQTFNILRRPRAAEGRRPGAAGRADHCRCSRAPTASQKMSKSLGNYIGVAEPPDGDVRQAHVDLRRAHAALLRAAHRAWTSTRCAATRRRRAPSDGGEEGARRDARRRASTAPTRGTPRATASRSASSSATSTPARSTRWRSRPRTAPSGCRACCRRRSW